jgi:glucuronate isomerase
MIFFGQLDAAKGWTKQLHLGALRNNNARLLRQLGPDTGFDSIGDYPQAETLAAYLDRLDQEKALPKTIIYNNNPANNYVFATMLGNFQDGTMAGKIQLGSGWWFLDQKEGIEWQLNALSNLGLLSRFVGMVTDSRSFMSYPRHEYFRRVLCNLVGRDVENGEIPDDDSLLGPMIQNICYANAQQYLQLPTEESNRGNRSRSSLPALPGSTHHAVAKLFGGHSGCLLKRHAKGVGALIAALAGEHFQFVGGFGEQSFGAFNPHPLKFLPGGAPHVFQKGLVQSPP